MTKQKAQSLAEVDNALDKFEPVSPDHPFFVDFKEVRGDFQDKEIYRMLNVRHQNNQYTYDSQVNRLNKTLLFLAGMRGIGKTSELAKYAKLLHNPDCFFVVTCNIDKELDMNDVEYMDILIFQLEKLLQKAKEVDLKINENILKQMAVWFGERVEEINTSLKGEGQASIEIKLENSFFGKLLGLAGGLKAGISGTKERAEKIRTTFKNRFNDFASLFNEFVIRVAEQLRSEKKAQEILFIVDGLEKTLSVDMRRKLIMDESNRIRQIKANTIFTLPVELMKEQVKIKMFAEIVNFPCVKLQDKQGNLIPKAIKKFEEFVFKRISETLFDSIETLHLAITYSGGVPKDLLRILETAAWYAEDEDTQITKNAVERAIQRLSNEMSRFLTEEEIAELLKIKQNLAKNKPTLFNEVLQDLVEKLIVLEYNDGTYKRVHPLVEISETYKQYVA